MPASPIDPQRRDDIVRSVSQLDAALTRRADQEREAKETRESELASKLIGLHEKLHERLDDIGKRLDDLERHRRDDDDRRRRRTAAHDDDDDEGHDPEEDGDDEDREHEPVAAPHVANNPKTSQRKMTDDDAGDRQPPRRRTDRRRRDDDDDMGVKQQRFDSVASLNGVSLEKPRIGDSADTYTRRSLRKLQFLLKPDDPLRKIDVDYVRDRAALAKIETDICDAAEARAHDDDVHPPGGLREVKTRDQSGREISRFYGPISAMLDPFRLPSVRVVPGSLQATANRWKEADAQAQAFAAALGKRG